jgi:hypothetical protein
MPEQHSALRLSACVASIISIASEYGLHDYELMESPLAVLIHRLLFLVYKEPYTIELEGV